MPPTITDVAKLASVSPNTVSRVINGADNVSPELAERVNRAIEDLGYVPNIAARSLRSRRTMWLALVVPNITDTHWHTVARGVEDAARSHEYAVLLCNTDDNPNKETRYLDVAVRQHVAGVIIAPCEPDADQLATLRGNKIPTVCINRRVVGWDVDTVYSDMRSAARTLTRHLIGLGHRRIALISGPQRHSAIRDRITGYQIALGEAGIPADPRLIKSGKFEAVSGEALTYQVLDEEPAVTAVVAANRMIALGVIRALGKRGLRIPQDMALVSFGDLEQAYFPFLTCVLEPAYELGTNAVQLLLSHIDAESVPPPRQVMLPTRLVVRYSCGGRSPSGDEPAPTLATPILEDAQPVLIKTLTQEELDRYAYLVQDTPMVQPSDDGARALAARPDSGRLLAALRHQQPDRLPHVQLWRPTRKLYEYILEGKPYPISDEEAGVKSLVTPEEHVALAQHLGVDAIVCSYNRRLRCGTVRTWSDLDQLEPPPSLTEYLTRLEEYLKASQGKGIGIVAGFSTCLYEAIRAADLSSNSGPAQAQFLLESLMNILLEQQERVMRSALDRFTEGIALVAFHSDAALLGRGIGDSGRAGELTTKCTDRLVHLVKEYNRPVLMQADTDVGAFLPVLHNMGVDGVILPGLVDDEVAELKDRWQGEMALVDMFPASVLAEGTEREIGEAVRDRYSELGRGGGYVLSTAAPESAGYPEQRFVDLCRTICTYGFLG